MKLNTFFNKLTRNAPDNPGGSPTEPDPAGEPPVEAAAPVEAPDFGWMPEEYRSGDAPDLEGFKTHYQELIAEQARRAEEQGEIPEAYDFALPEEFDPGVDLPEGVKIELDTENPMFSEFGDFLKENSISQQVATGLTGMLAKYQAQQYAAHHAAATKEFETLGATDAARDARVSTVKRALETRLPSDQAEALMAAVGSAAGVKALEAILKPRGVQAPSPQPTGADWDDLSPADRLRRANELSMAK